MLLKKQKKEEVAESKCDCWNDLKIFLSKNMPAMFDRTPDITGNLDKFVDEIIKIVK